MVSRKFIDWLKNVSMFAFVFTIIITFFILLNFVIVFLGDHVQSINYAIVLQENIKQKNLSLPLPNLSEFQTSKFDPATDFYLNNFNKPLNEFLPILQQHYVYNSSYDCKYWAYVWSLYWKTNKDKYNWDFEYLTTENHIFVMVSNSTGYCILDLDDIYCRGITI